MSTSETKKAPQEAVDLQVESSGPATGEARESGLDTDRAMAMVTRLLRVTYPHDGWPDGPYERCARAVLKDAQEDAGDDRLLTIGLDGLDRAAGGDFLDASDEQAEAFLRDRADDPFFRRIRSTAVVALYDDHEVWEILGYEGASFDKGGYLERGFDDLDWLPDPRVEEYDGDPRPEIVTQPTTGNEAR